MQLYETRVMAGQSTHVVQLRADSTYSAMEILYEQYGKENVPFMASEVSKARATPLKRFEITVKGPVSNNRVSVYAASKFSAYELLSARYGRDKLIGMPERA